MKLEPGRLRYAMAFGIAALLIPVSLLLGLSAAKSIIVSVVTGLLFVGLAVAMGKVMK
jgi:hypothetical protein